MSTRPLDIRNAMPRAMSSISGMPLIRNSPSRPPVTGGAGPGVGYDPTSGMKCSYFPLALAALARDLEEAFGGPDE